MTKIVLAKSVELNKVFEYFSFNEYATIIDELWDSTRDLHGRHVINDTYLNSTGLLLVLDYTTLISLLSYPAGMSQVEIFLKNNYIWVWQEIDSYGNLLNVVSKNKNFYDLLSSKNVTFFVDAEPSNCLLDNVNYVVIPVPVLWNTPRIKDSIVTKESCEFDFMLTTFFKRSSVHRKILFNALSQNTDVYNRGLISARSIKFKHKNYSEWVGDRPQQHSWHDGHPSMDLYLNSWIEIVPETYYKNGYFITEKTIKPIFTKTPFLMVSTCGFLEYLKRLGFKTFDTLIDESYDLEYRVEDRVKKLVDTLSIIIKNGAKEFYHESESILEHNHQHLAKINGLAQYQTDLMFRTQLEKINILKSTT
jgi:hypothetical protein